MSDRPKVETAQGWLEGRQTSGISRFLGVPYAKPPLGRLRFQPPEPPEPWSKSRLANRKGPVSMQAALPLFRFMNAGAARQSEDCLYLNIWSPGLDAARRPVLVWIHGGAFLIGAGSTAIYDGEWLARQGEMVVVTLNYRLGALGFVHLDNVCRSDFEQSSNLGLRDQLAALEWIRENIESFGGDASNVTVCGQSAGAMSVAALLGAGAAQRPFRRAILQSGAGRHVIDRARADRIAERFLEFLGKPLLSVEALSEIPTSRILRAQGQLNRELMNLSDPMVMLPCVDGELVREQPLQNVEAGRVRDVDLMIGTTLDEWKLFVPLEASFPPFGMNALSDRFSKWLPKLSRNAPDPKIAAEQYREAIRARGGRTTAYEVWSAYQSARIFHQPANALADAHSRAGGRIYSYLFAWSPPMLGRSVGACHGLDIPFVFGLPSRPMARVYPGPLGPLRRLSTRMQAAWASFAHSGQPAHEELPEWEAYDAANRCSMLLDHECSLVSEPLEAELKLIAAWN